MERDGKMTKLLGKAVAGASYTFTMLERDLEEENIGLKRKAEPPPQTIPSAAPPKSTGGARYLPSGKGIAPE